MVVIGPYFDLLKFNEPHFVNATLFYKYFWVEVSVFASRLPYYFVWRLSEGANVILGLGYNGIDSTGKIKYDGLDNINITKIELPMSVRDSTTYWNMRVANWLKNYVYFRVGDPLSNNPSVLAMGITQVTSAFWHGIYFGYYASFIYLTILVDFQRRVRKRIRPLFVSVNDQGKESPIQPWKTLYDIIGVILTSLFVNYCFAFMEVLYYDRITVFGELLNYGGHIVTFVVWVTFVLLDTIAPVKSKSFKKRTE